MTKGWRTWAARLAVALAACVALACGVLGETPAEVADDFWRSLSEGDFAAAHARAAATDEGALREMAAEYRVESVILGEALSNDERALIETTLLLRRGTGSVEVAFETHLVHDGSAWRVDVPRSRQELESAAFVASMRRLEDMMRREVHEFGEVIEKGAHEAVEAVREALESWELSREP